MEKNGGNWEDREPNCDQTLNCLPCHVNMLNLYSVKDNETNGNMEMTDLWQMRFHGNMNSGLQQGETSSVLLATLSKDE